MYSETLLRQSEMHQPFDSIFNVTIMKPDIARFHLKTRMETAKPLPNHIRRRWSLIPQVRASIVITSLTNLHRLVFFTTSTCWSWPDSTRLRSSISLQQPRTDLTNRRETSSPATTEIYNTITLSRETSQATRAIASYTIQRKGRNRGLPTSVPLFFWIFLCSGGSRDWNLILPLLRWSIRFKSLSWDEHIQVNIFKIKIL